MQQQCGLAGRSSVESCPPVQESIRRFLCAGCRAVAYLCTACDRGQRYCSDVCAHEARRRAQRESDRRYQSGERGRLKHAERARRYRERRRSVTDQGPVSSPQQDLRSRVRQARCRRRHRQRKRQRRSRAPAKKRISASSTVIAVVVGAIRGFVMHLYVAADLGLKGDRGGADRSAQPELCAQFCTAANREQRMVA